MKSNLFKTSLSLLLLIVASFSFAQNPSDIQFEKKVQKFKKVDEGHRITLNYIFTNNSNYTLTLVPPKVDCSCTVVIIPEHKIKPNSSDTITVKFDTKNKIGYQDRDILLKFIPDEKPQAPIDTKITFKGMVKATKESKAAYKEEH